MRQGPYLGIPAAGYKLDETGRAFPLTGPAANDSDLPRQRTGTCGAVGRTGTGSKLPNWRPRNTRCSLKVTTSWQTRTKTERLKYVADYEGK
jgi:hypothetical protein